MKAQGKYRKTLCTALMMLCLSSQSLPLWAKNTGHKSGDKAHPVKKIDINPNDNDGDIWTYTLESNSYAEGSFLGLSGDFSSRQGWDLQIASYNIPVSAPDTPDSNWDSYVNLSKTFKLDEHYKIMLGTQNGTNVFASQRRWHNFDYGLFIYQPTRAIDLHAGLYYANKALSGTTNTYDFTLGFSLELIADTLSVEGDYLHGHSSVSGANVNVLYQLLPNFQLYAGIGVPESHSGNEFFGILGMNFSLRDGF